MSHERCEGLITIHSSLHLSCGSGLKNGAVAKGLTVLAFVRLPVRGDRLVNSQKVTSVAHRRRSSQGNQPQNEDAQLIGLPLAVQSLTGR